MPHSQKSIGIRQAKRRRSGLMGVELAESVMNLPHPSAAKYRSYHDLPPLAGLCSMADPQRPGCPVEECGRRLKRFPDAFKRLHEIFVARITAEPIYELKMAFSLHGHYCAEHVAALPTRGGGISEPPTRL